MNERRANKASKPTKADRDAASRLRAVWDKRKAKLGLTQAKVADAMGISQPAVSQYLDGDIPLNFLALLHFCILLECDPSTIRDDLPEQKGLRRIQSFTAPAGAGIDEETLADALAVLRGVAQWQGVSVFEPDARSIVIAYGLIEDMKEHGEKNVFALVRAFLEKQGELGRALT
jgi:transcriptional regulator with XRE-family HTH domain